MSAIPEFNRTDETGKPEISGTDDDSLSLLPEILRGAAFISSGGRVYRLFSEEDEDAIRNSPLGTPLQIDPIAFTAPTVAVTEEVEETIETADAEESAEGDVVPLPEAEPASSASPASGDLKELETVLETLDAELEFFSHLAPPPIRGAERQRPKRVDLLSAGPDRSELPVEDVIRRMRAVEGICGAREKSREILVAAAASEQKAEPVRKIGVPLRSEEKERPSLKLYEAFSNTPSKPRGEPVRKDPPNDTAAVESPRVDTVILRLFETPPPVRQMESRKEKRVEKEEPEKTVSETVPEPVAAVHEIAPKEEPKEEGVKPAAPVISEMSVPEDAAKTCNNIVIRLHVGPLRKRSRPFSPRTHDVPMRETVETADVADIPEADALRREEFESTNPVPTASVDDHVDEVTVEETVEETTTVDKVVSETVVECLKRETLVVEEDERTEDETTILFPSPSIEAAGHETISGESGDVNEANVDSLVWRLHWQPMWPKHLASLERQASNQIRYLADHLEMQLEQGRKVISFNSYRPGDGCTTLSLCAARELTERGHRLLLADAHRQHPELAVLLELDIHPHVYEIMTLIPDRLELLPWSETFIEVDSYDETHAKTFTDIVASLREEYDGILLDGGSLIESPLAERVAQWRQMQSDGVLLIVNTKNPQPVNIQAVAHRLRQFNIDLLGVAENYV